jgi:hypothetical protein
MTTQFKNASDYRSQSVQIFGGVRFAPRAAVARACLGSYILLLQLLPSPPQTDTTHAFTHIAFSLHE